MIGAQYGMTKFERLNHFSGIYTYIHAYAKIVRLGRDGGKVG